MRLAAIAAVLLTCRLAAADVTPPYRLVIDGALGGDTPAVATEQAAAALAACFTKTPATGSAVVWLEVTKAGAVSSAKVRGTGAPVLDGCIATALRKATVAKPVGPLILVGHLDALDAAKQDSNAFFPSPRISSVAMMIDPRGAAWQLSVKRIGYTSNRAADIAQALDAQAPALAACAAKRAKQLATANLVAWSDGKAVVRGSGDAAYDACVTKAFSAIKLPAATSAMWMELELRRPGEPLAPKGTTHDQAVRDALRDAVRTKKTELETTCLDKHPKAKLGKLTVELRGGKVAVKAIATGDPAVDTCVRTKLADVSVPRAVDGDTAEVELDLE